jgi:polyisoprenoid-binding protein YceI
MKNIIAPLALSFVLFSSTSFALEAELQPNNSQLNFVSIKKSAIAEIHEFQSLAGSIDSTGKVSIEIDLASVNTNVAIRDDRMKSFFFETDRFSKAILTANIDMKSLDALTKGDSVQKTLEATLDLHGESVVISIDAIVTKLANKQLSVVSAQPIIINTSDFKLVEGVDKLRKLAGLSAISQAVPVTFALTFNIK